MALIRTERFIDNQIPTVIKVGGSLGNEFDEIIQDLASLRGYKILVVHGGGPSIDAVLKQRNIQPKKLEGIRVTDESTLRVVREVLDRINISYVRQLNALGVNVSGYTSEAGLLKGVIENRDLGFVGRITNVEGTWLRRDMHLGAIPVVSPIARTQDGSYLNVNGDTVAGAIARALDGNLIIVTDVPGVLDSQRRLLEELRRRDFEELRKAGVVDNGMIPKINAALVAAERGRRVLICQGSELINAFIGSAVGTWVQN